MEGDVELFLKCKLKNVDIPIINKFKSILNQDGCWQSVAAMIPPSFSKLISEQQIRVILERYKEKSPADVLLDEFRKRNARVCDIIPFLENPTNPLDQALMLFKPNEPLQIIQQPDKLLNASKEIVLHCKASGFPTPKYQWYKDERELVDQIFSELSLQNISSNDEGVYYCEIYNCDRVTNEPIDHLKSQECTVIVKNNDNLYQHQISSLEIVKHPIVPSKKLKHGADLILHCIAQSPEPIINYRWFKNGKLMDGETESELRLYNILPEKGGVSSWTYQCSVFDNKTQVISNRATISLGSPSPETQYFANRKIALLFGNQKYEQLGKLQLPVADVETLSKILIAKGFEIYAFQDLTLTEMKNAVAMFANLIEDGDYVVFYFAGHGFEECNLHYMIPVDAGDNFSRFDSVTVENVLQSFQHRTPALILMLIDMCRVNPDRKEPSSITSSECIITVKESNVLIAYATSPNMNANEVLGQYNGMFIQHLKKYLSQNKKWIVDVIYDVKRAMSITDQSPWTSGNLSKKISLDDFCNCTCKAVDFELDLQDKAIEFERYECNVSVQLHRHRGVFLNAIDVVFKIPNYDKNTSSYSISFCFAMNGKYGSTYKCENETFTTTISNIQKLQKDLIVKIIVTSKTRGVEPECQPVNLGKPLIAKYNFWENQIE